MARLSDDDFELSMAVSRPAKNPQHNVGLRDMLVHRLSDTDKAVARIGLHNQEIAIFCEGCQRWTRVEEFPLEFDCECGRSYTTEFVVMAEVEA